jgi:HK97 family phage major capsid protein
MPEIIDMKQFETFAQSLKEALDMFKGQQDEINVLKQALHDTKSKVLSLSAMPSYDQKATYGFTDQADAKKFISFVKGIYLRDPMVKDMTEGTDSEGGYLVPQEWRGNLIQLLETYGVARRECTIIPMAREELVMPKLTGGVQVYWIGEGATISPTQPSFGELKMIAKKMAALVPITSELLADSAIAIANLLMTLFAQAIAKEEDRVVFTGDVAGASDPFNGVLFDPDVTDANMAAGADAFTDLDADFLADVVASVPPALQGGARWYMHRTVFNIIRKLQTKEYKSDLSAFEKSGEYVYSQPQGTDPGTIWGYPYTLVESMPDITDSAASTPFIIFGNMMHYYIADRQQMSLARSEHVGFAQDKIYLRVIQRESMAAAIPEAFTVVKTAA